MDGIALVNDVSRRELIAFRVGTQEFCVDIMSVREIRGWTPATAVPQSPDFVIGMINLRGAVLPIIDLAVRLGLPAAEPTAKHVIIFVQVERQVVGLLVDGVSDILTVEDGIVQPIPTVAPGMTNPFVLGILAIGGSLISLIALDRLLPAQERKAA